jgi:formate dehydrogenase assembly factor FdhD
MRTPGNDLEMASGFLLTEGTIESRDQLAKIRAAGLDSGARSFLKLCG